MNIPRLQDGKKKLEDALDSLKYMDFMDKKPIESAFFHPISKFATRVGRISEV